jgi:predicted transcriptional regulator
MAERVVTAHIPGELAKQVDRLSDQLDRPKGWIIKEALTRFVELEKRRYELTLEALADVDAGQTFDDAEIGAWLKKLTGKRKTAKAR